MAGRGLYAALGVGPGAEAGELRGAYLRACRETHPDRAAGAGGGGEAFLEVQAAWEVLRDPERRGEYDRAVARAEVRRRAVEDRCTFYDEVELEDLETHTGGAPGGGGGGGGGGGQGSDLCVPLPLRGAVQPHCRRCLRARRGGRRAVRLVLPVSPRAPGRPRRRGVHEMLTLPSSSLSILSIKALGACTYPGPVQLRSTSTSSLAGLPAVPTGAA